MNMPADPDMRSDRHPAHRSLVTHLSSRVRSVLSPTQRSALRTATEPWVKPIGSVRGAAVTDAVALTYDDGPGPHTASVLDVLERHGATATFFVLADRAEAEPELLRRMLGDGHEVALHGVDHQRLTALPASEVRSHIAEGKRRLEACTGQPVRYFRPPYGSQTPRTFVAARRCGLRIVVWSCDADDWIDHEPEHISQLALERLQPGGILLLHDGFEADPDAPLPEPGFDRAEVLGLVLSGLAQRGLRATGVGRLLESGAARRTAWFRP